MDKESLCGRIKSLDLDAVIQDLHALMTTSQDWWPADLWPLWAFFIRMAGTAQVRTASATAAAGQPLAHTFGASQQLAGHVNLDKARDALAESSRNMAEGSPWADLMIRRR